MYIKDQEDLDKIIKSGGVPSSATYLRVYNCSGLSEMTIPSSVTNLYVYNCSGLSELTVQSSVTDLSVDNCSSLSELNVPSSVTYLTVHNCSSLSELNVPSSVTHLYVFNCSSLSELNVPSSVTDLSVDNCSSLSELNVPSSVTYLRVDNCSGLSEMTIPSSVTNLYVYNCSGLSELNVPSSVSKKGKLRLERIDGVLTAHSGKWKKHGDIERLSGFMVNGSPPFLPTHIVRGGGYAAHGETLNEAIQDHAFKLLGNIDAAEVAKIIKADNTVTMARWRAITGACSFGTRHHLASKGFDEIPSEMPLSDALKLSAGTSYGERFAREMEGL